VLTSFRSRLPLAVLALGLAAVGLTAWESSTGATTALRQATFDRLTGIRESKRRQVEDYFQQLDAHVTALSSDESTVSALESLRTAWDRLHPAPDAASLDGRLRAVYAAEVGDGDPASVTAWLPDDGRQRLLQRWFIVDSPYEHDNRDQLLEPAGSGHYGAGHARYHPTLQRYLSAFGFYDILLVDAGTARVLYSVRKEADLGAALTAAPAATTGLGRAYTRASALTEPGVVIEDYTPYPPSANAPAAFVAAPIWRAGNRIGVLAIQVSVDDVNHVMTAGRNWGAEGLGATGQTYIAGPDGRLRSDDRFGLEHAGAYLDQLTRAGVARDTVERVRRYRTGVLAAPVSPEAQALLRARASGTALGRDFRGVDVLRSHAPVSIPGLDWFLVAEIEAAEAFAPIAALHRRMWTLGAVVSAAVLLAGWWLSRSMTRPVAMLARRATALGAGDFSTRVPAEGPSETRALATAFNRMVDDLQRSTVSREALNAVNEQLHALASRLIEAQEDERRRIAGDLHDDVTQQLASLAMTVSALKQHRTGNDDDWDAVAAAIQRQIAGLSAQLHSLARQLHPAVLDDLGLATALEAECQRSAMEGASVRVRIDGDVDRLDRPAQLAIYRAVQEAVRNAGRHGQARHVTVTLHVRRHEAVLLVQDDGAGFDRAAPHWRPGVGLAAMHERARALGGSVEIRSASGQGTTVTLTLPLRSADAR